jgi:PAS domain S-box-containing protein
MKSKDKTGYMVILTLLLTFGFLVLWEFWLEELVLVNYLEGVINKSATDRWTLIVACLSIVCLSLVLPLKNMKNNLDEMKSMENALHGEQALSKVFFSVDNSIILVINNSNQIMQINKKTSFLLGYQEDEMLKKDWISLLIEEKGQAELKKQYQQFVKDKNQNFIRFTSTAKAKDGTEKTIDWQCAPLRDEHGNIYGSINSGQDISEQIRMRGELSQLKGKYEPHIKKLTSELEFNKKKYHSEAIKSANARSRFKFWFELENTLMHLSPEQTNNQEDIKKRIQKALKLFGEISNVDHGYVFKFTQSGSHMINTHLWVSGEPMLEPDQRDEIPLDNFAWFKKNIQKKETIHIPKIKEMPKEASSEREVYLSQGIKSLINIPIVHNDSAVGYIGFETNENEKTWDNDEINLIKIIARLIASITNPPSPSELKLKSEDTLSLEEIPEIQPEIELPKVSSKKISKALDDPKFSEPATAPSIDKELAKVRESFEKEFQEKIKSMEHSHSQLMSELKERKEIETDLRANRDSIERQLNEKSIELEKLLTEAKAGNKEKPNEKSGKEKTLPKDSPVSSMSTQEKELKEMRNALQKKETELATLKAQLKSKSGKLTPSETQESKTKITEKAEELKSLQKRFEAEKSAKDQLQEQLAKAEKSLKTQSESLKPLQEANQTLEQELEELRKTQKEADSKSFQLEDTQQELESLEIANEQLMSDIEEKNFLIDEAKEKAARYEQMDLPLFTLDENGNILTWNRTAASTTGFIPELALESPISILFAEKEEFDFENEFLAPLRENSRNHLEIPIKKPNGTVFNALISLASFKDRNGILSTLGYLINLSQGDNQDEINTIKRQFTTLLGNSGLILVTLSPDYLIADMNDKAESTFQWNRENTLKKNFFETVIEQENWQEVSKDIQERISTQASIDMETKITKDDTERVFLWNLVKEIDPKDNSTKGIIAIAQDVTDMRNALKSLDESQKELDNAQKELDESQKELSESQKELSESQNNLASTQSNLDNFQKEMRENQLLLNLLIDKSEDGLISIDENGIIQSFNEGAEKLFGFTSHEITGQNVSQLMPDPYSKEHDNYIKKYTDTGTSSFVGGAPKELIGKNKDGSIFPIEITLKETYKNDQRLFIGLVRDIRKRKRMEIQLAEIQEKYHRFMDAESDAVLIVDGATKQILECNPAAPQFYGYELEEFMDLNFKDLVAEVDQSPNGNNSLTISELGSTHRIPQTHLIKKDGTLFPASIATSSFHFKDTEYELKVIHDISTEVHLQEQLKRNQEQHEATLLEKQNLIEETIQEKENMVQILVQEAEQQKINIRQEKLNTLEHITTSMVDLINNPIQGIENILGQVKERAEMADIHKGLVTVAMNECRRVADLINKLKNFQPPTKENLESMDVHQVLDEVIQDNRDTIRDRTITLEKNYADDLPLIDGITPQIRQAINNIVKNAEESLSEDEGIIIISTEQDEENIKIHIQDTGCGIEKADMERIFDPFFTTKSAMHRPGLGLLASLGIIKNHKGNIDVHSVPGEGATFTVTLPLKQALNQNGGSHG